jgi:glucose-6-phosphate isomerase
MKANKIAWNKILELKKTKKTLVLNDLFAKNPQRGYEYNRSVADLNLDYSKSLVNDKVLKKFEDLAEKINLQEQINQITSGKLTNSTEKRSVGHMWLRSKFFRNNSVSGVVDIDVVQKNFLDFAEKVRSGVHKGSTGKNITDVVNIGIGGSDLGPAMIYNALEHLHDGKIRCHFISNIDETEISTTLKNLDASTTLLVITSKTFSTVETMTNANYAKKWLIKSLGTSNIDQHLVAISTDTKACKEFGIDKHNVFPFWDWVGGRYSLLSSVGISIALGYGSDVFTSIQKGASKIDENLQKIDFKTNPIFIHAAISLWNLNVMKFGSLAVIPYASALSRFPAFLQQLWMESNGKSVDKDGNKIKLSTCPVIFGEPGTNSQHSFFQLLHQGTEVIPVDFIVVKSGMGQDRNFQDSLLANALAQASVLAFGKSKAELKSENVDQELINHKVMPGNRPSMILSLTKLDPSTLGQLVAFYEASVILQGLMLNINSFDQWGVELGKKTAVNVLQSIKNINESKFDSSTTNQIATYRKLNP